MSSRYPTWAAVADNAEAWPVAVAHAASHWSAVRGLCFGSLTLTMGTASKYQLTPAVPPEALAKGDPAPPAVVSVIVVIVSRSVVMVVCGECGAVRAFRYRTVMTIMNYTLPLSLFLALHLLYMGLSMGLRRGAGMEKGRMAGVEMEVDGVGRKEGMEGTGLELEEEEKEERRRRIG